MANAICRGRRAASIRSVVYMSGDTSRSSNHTTVAGIMVVHGEMVFDLFLVRGCMPGCKGVTPSKVRKTSYYRRRMRKQVYSAEELISKELYQACKSHECKGQNAGRKQCDGYSPHAFGHIHQLEVLTDT